MNAINAVKLKIKYLQHSNIPDEKSDNVFSKRF